MAKTQSKQIQDITDLLINGIELIAEVQFSRRTNHFEGLIKAVRDDFNRKSLDGFSFKANKEVHLFLVEIEGMKAYLDEHFTRIMKYKKKYSPDMVYKMMARPHVLNNSDFLEVVRSIRLFSGVGSVLVESLLSFMATKFGPFYDVIKELFGVIKEEFS